METSNNMDKFYSKLKYTKNIFNAGMDDLIAGHDSIQEITHSINFLLSELFKNFVSSLANIREIKTDHLSVLRDFNLVTTQNYDYQLVKRDANTLDLDLGTVYCNTGTQIGFIEKECDKCLQDDEMIKKI